MTILLFGANGQVGHELRSALVGSEKVVALGRHDVDFSSPESLRAVVRRYHPSLIVNAAAYTAVDKAESDSDCAIAVNSTAPAVLAEEAEAIDAAVVHYSTDYVFDGCKATPYVETDLAVPQSIYGKSKRDGELAVERHGKHLIFRTSWVFGAHGSNFIKTMLRLAKEQANLRVVGDQIGAPTSAKLLAEFTSNVVSRLEGKPASDPRWGLYHLTAAGETSWHGLACYVIGRASAKGVRLQATPETIEEISTAEYPTSVKRPANSRLSTEKFQRSFGLQMPDWRLGVNSVVDQIVQEMR